MPPELAAACGEVRPAGADDRVGGQLARYVAEPASTAEAAALLQAAARLGYSVVPRGSGTRLDWGLPPSSCDLIVDTGRLSSVIEHEAGDLVVRVQAGMRLDDLQAKLAAAGQRLALDPPDGGTIGGVLATNAAGPLRFRYGAPRDLLIGITLVRADGTVAKAGGKVVKNVAGYDLGKLFAGSYGTLGLITEATFRLHPLPPARTAVGLDCADPAAAAAAVHAIASSPLAPSAIELHWRSAADPITVTALLEGDEASVPERAERMRSLLAGQGGAGALAVGPSPLVRPLADRPARPLPGTELRVGLWVGQLESVLGCLRQAAAQAELDPAISGAAAAGVLEVALTADAPAQAVAGFVGDLRARFSGLAGRVGGPPNVASTVVVRAPAAVREAVDVWGPVPGAELMQAIKDQFDPERRMAPGRFAGGI